MKCAFVSGASRGIGRGIATALASNGYALALTCEKNIDLLHDFCHSLEQKYGIMARGYACDMGNPDTVAATVEEIRNTFPSMDVVVNNAGISYVGLITDLNVEDWNRIVSVNLSSLFYTTKAFLPDMVHRKSGAIINISSMWGNVGASCEVAYSATKGGVNAYTKALAKEVAPSGITVNAIACGVIDTDMNGHLDATEKAELMEEIPMGRFGTPEDVGQCVLGILSSPYLTGQIIALDGGYL